MNGRHHLRYRVGEVVKSKGYMISDSGYDDTIVEMFDNKYRECSEGIHLFMTKEQAERYLNV